jgi:hypothetical protein
LVFGQYAKVKREREGIMEKEAKKIPSPSLVVK